MASLLPEFSLFTVYFSLLVKINLILDRPLGHVGFFVSMRSFPSLYQINYSRGGVPKLPVVEAWVSVDGLRRDGHRNKVLHGGPDRAICVFSFELIQTLRQEGHTIYPGASGENFTLTGLDWAHIQPGDHMKVGEEVRIEFTSFCEPCRRIAQWFHKKDYHRIDQQQYPGWSRLYARVLSEGTVRRGDRVSYLKGFPNDGTSA